jgi:hypothetical protein
MTWPPGIDDAARDRDLGLKGLIDGDSHHFLRAVVGQALAVGDVHVGPSLRRELCASQTATIKAGYRRPLL